MLPSARELARRHAAFCLKYGVEWRDCAQALEGAVRLAAALAGDRPEDEPAALLFALTQPRALGDSWSDFPIAEARWLAREQGLHLDVKVTDVDLEILRLRVVDRRARMGIGVEDLLRLGAAELRVRAGHLGYGELRDYLVARTRPLHLRPVK